MHSRQWTSGKKRVQEQEQKLLSFRLIARISRTIFHSAALPPSLSLYPPLSSAESQDNIRQIALAQVDKEINVWLVRNDVRINQGFVCGLFAQYLPPHTRTPLATPPLSQLPLPLPQLLRSVAALPLTFSGFLFSLARPRGVYVIFFN